MGTMMIGVADPSGPALGFATTLVLKASVLLLLAALATRVMGRRSAALRHFVWTLAVGGVLALPALEAALPWSLNVLPAWSAAEAPAPEVFAPASGSELVREPARGDLVAPVARVEPRPGTDAETGATGPAVSGAAAFGPTASEAPAAARRPSVQEANGVALGRRLGVVWAVVATLLLLHQALGRIVLWALSRRAQPIDEPVFLREWTALAEAAGLRRPVRLLRSERSRVPMTWGVRRPVVLLPRDSRDWTRARIRIVLQHELAHVRRMDAFTQGLGRLACALHWFNPLAWWAVARMGAESEQAADDIVLRGGARASDYAGHLLELVTALGPHRAPAGALPLAQRSRFEGRLVAILDPARERTGMRRAGALGLAAGVVAVVTLLGAAAPAPARSSSDTDDAAVGDAARQDQQGEDVEEVAGPPASPVRPLPTASTEASGRGTADAGPPASAQAGSDDEAGAELLFDSTSVAALVRALREDSDEDVRRTAAWALGQLEDRMATPALMQALRQDAAVEVRRTAAWALGQIEDPAAAPALGAALEDDDVEVRRTALWALGQIEAVEAVEPLSRALRDPEPEVRDQAAWALGQIESREAVGPLTAALDDDNDQVRANVIWALGQIEDPASAPALAGALRDPSAEVRRQAAWALGQIESEAAVEGLLAALAGDDDADVRRQSAWALGQIESDAAVPGLAAALSDADSEIARTAAWAIGQIEPSSAPAQLIEAARTGTGELRRTALWALVQIEDPAALPALIDALRDEDARIRSEGLEGLAGIRDDSAIRAITELLEDPDPEVRAAAVRALAGGLRRRGGSDPNPNPNPNPQPQPRPRPNGG